MNTFKKILLSIFIITSSFNLAACDEVSNNVSIETKKTAFERAKVVRVVDGDTIHVDLNGNREKIRLIGINTPEISHDENRDDFMGREATKFTTNSLLNNEVYLEKDISDTDTHGRLLRYVWIKLPNDSSNPTKDEVENLTINAILVQNGYAFANHYPPDEKYQDVLDKLALEAKNNKIGIWDNKARSKFENSDIEYSNEGPIKGNKNSMIYHLPAGEGYDSIAEKNTIYFDSEADAIKAGFRKAHK